MNSTYLKKGLLEACFCASICTLFLGASPQEADPTVAPITPAKDQVGDIDVIGDNAAEHDNYNAYLCASYQHCTGRVHMAYETYKKLLKQHPSPHAYNGFFNFLFDTEQFSALVKIYEAKAEAFDKVFGDNIDIQLMLAQSFLSLNQEAKAEKIFTKLGQQNPENEQVAYFSTVALMKNNQVDKALEIIEAALKKPSLKQKHFLFHFLKSKVLVQQGKYPQALASIEKSLEMFPRFNQGILLKAVLLEQLGRVNDAIAGYKNFLDLVGRDLGVEKQLVHLLSQKRDPEAQKYIKQLQANSPEYHYEQAMEAFEAKDFKKALTLFDKALKIAPLFAPARFGKIETLLQMKMVPELLTFMQALIERNVDDVEMLHTLLVLRKTIVPTDKIIQTLQAIERIKPVVTVLASIADLSVELNNFTQALMYYDRIATRTNDEGLKSKTFFQMGYIYFVTNQPTKLEGVLQKALQYKPVYPSAYNLLAYHYAQTNNKLPAALDLVEKALAQAPDCHYYRDTQGCILYKLGKKELALSAFKKALEVAPDDTVIKQHLKAAQENNL